MAIKKIISGAQTGADRAALDAAIANDIPHGGWVPKGRKAEDGAVPGKYRVAESSSGDYRYRTEINVKDSDGTLILTHGKLAGGSALTLKYSNKHNKPCLHINLNEIPEATAVIKISQWIHENNIGVLNCAGSRASKDPEIYNAVYNIIDGLIYLEDSGDADVFALPYPGIPGSRSHRHEKADKRPFRPGGRPAEDGPLCELLLLDSDDVACFCVLAFGVLFGILHL